MPVQFVIGRAGSGKTAYCIDRIAQAIRQNPLGPPIYWLLPRQATFIAERPDLFLAVGGGWGRMGITHIRLSETDEDTLTGALQTAWKLRAEKNRKAGSKSGASLKRKPAAKREPAKSR